MAVTSRFLIDLRVGPRTLETAKQLAASVALCTTGLGAAPPLLLFDDHLSYPAAVLQVFGEVRHRRRKNGRGRRKHPDLKPPPGLLAGVVRKVRDERGNLQGVQTRALFGRLKDTRARIAELGIGREINTAHVERLNGTVRGQQSRLTRRTRSPSRESSWMQWSLSLWRDIYNWIRPHGSLKGQTPAMAAGLTDHRWSASEYVRHPVHVSDLDRAIWDEERQETLTSALDHHNRPEPLPMS